MSTAFLERWLEEVVATPGMTGITDPEVARGVLLDDALRALPLLEGRAGPVVDVGSGGGSPGLPLASVLPDHSFTLLEADRRKCDFLERSTRRSLEHHASSGGARRSTSSRRTVSLSPRLWPSQPSPRSSASRSCDREASRSCGSANRRSGRPLPVSLRSSAATSRPIARGCWFSRRTARLRRDSHDGPEWRRSVRWPRNAAVRCGGAPR